MRLSTLYKKSKNQYKIIKRLPKNIQNIHTVKFIQYINNSFIHNPLTLSMQLTRQTQLHLHKLKQLSNNLIHKKNTS